MKFFIDFNFPVNLHLLSPASAQQALNQLKMVHMDVNSTLSKTMWVTAPFWSAGTAVGTWALLELFLAKKSPKASELKVVAFVTFILTTALPLQYFSELNQFNTLYQKSVLDLTKIIESRTV
ncbi:MAG: hypothetical protein KDK76_07360 [Chlamydiia bacterium]|nr:hypothetical protein [Chlamydiia bacterium]